jgi:hypothetical protein
VRLPWPTNRRAAQLERATVADKSDGQGVAMSRAILFDAIFAIGFSIVTAALARFLWAMF